MWKAPPSAQNKRVYLTFKISLTFYASYLLISKYIISRHADTEENMGNKQKKSGQTHNYPRDQRPSALVSRIVVRRVSRETLETLLTITALSY